MNSDFTIAVHCLVYLAYLPGHMASSEAIAHNVSTNPARIRKIMSALRKARFVQTKEGVRGGYILSLVPEEITLGHIYKVISLGALQPNWQTGDPAQACPISSNTQRVMDDIFEDAEESMALFLHQYTVADILQKIKTEK